MTKDAARGVADAHPSGWGSRGQREAESYRTDRAGCGSVYGPL